MDQESSSLDCEDSVEMEFICFLGSYYNTIIGVIHCASSGLPHLFACCGYFLKNIYFYHLLFIYRFKTPFLFKPDIQRTSLKNEKQNCRFRKK